jgi:hypothetical protein
MLKRSSSVILASHHASTYLNGRLIIRSEENREMDNP